VYAREFDGLRDINPWLLLPVYVEGEMHLWGSNLIIEYLMGKYPNAPGSPAPAFASTFTRPERHWEDSRILVTLETLTDTIMNLRQMKMSGFEPEQIAYLNVSATASMSSSIGWKNRRRLTDLRRLFSR
jgi:glutathione S-transferase